MDSHVLLFEVQCLLEDPSSYLENAFSARKEQAAQTQSLGVELDSSVNVNLREIKFMKVITNQSMALSS